MNPLFRSRQAPQRNPAVKTSDKQKQQQTSASKAKEKGYLKPITEVTVSANKSAEKFSPKLNEALAKETEGSGKKNLSVPGIGKFVPTFAAALEGAISRVSALQNENPIARIEAQKNQLIPQTETAEQSRFSISSRNTQGSGLSGLQSQIGGLLGINQSNLGPASVEKFGATPTQQLQAKVATGNTVAARAVQSQRQPVQGTAPSTLPQVTVDSALTVEEVPAGPSQLDLFRQQQEENAKKNNPERHKIVAFFANDIDASGFPKSVTLAVKRSTFPQSVDKKYTFYRKSVFVPGDFQKIGELTSENFKVDPRFKQILDEQYSSLAPKGFITFEDKSVESTAVYAYKVIAEFEAPPIS